MGVNIGVQISLSETFCFAAADLLSLGIPLVGSKAITYIPAEWQVADEGDPCEVADKIDEVFAWSRANPSATRMLIHDTYVEDQHHRRIVMESTLLKLLGD